MRHTGLYHKHQRMLVMRDNYLFQRICRECAKWEQEVKGKMVCDSRPYSECLRRFINMIEDWGDD